MANNQTGEVHLTVNSQVLIMECSQTIGQMFLKGLGAIILKVTLNSNNVDIMLVYNVCHYKNVFECFFVTAKET